MSVFCVIYNLKNPVKEPTCFKNPDNLSCIDLMLTNRYQSFMPILRLYKQDCLIFRR